MADIAFCFGLKGDFYFYSPERQTSSTIWPRASQDFSELTDINRPLSVALGPTPDWFFGYESIDGQQKWVRRREKAPGLKYGHSYKSWSARQAAYDRLESWLRSNASQSRDMSQTGVYLGPHGSYFAVSPGGGVTWAEIPARLEALIDLNQPARTPTSIALGLNKTWFALWQDGSSSCNLDVEYPKLERLLRRHGKSGVKSIALSPSESDEFAISFKDGSSHIRGPVSEPNLHQLNSIMIAAAKTPMQPLTMQVQVCALHTTSPPIELPARLLNKSKIIFPGTPGDVMGKEHESFTKGAQKGTKPERFGAKSSTHKCMVM